ncbi:MAG: hypothetical protein ABIP48_05165 [Planctomycetota bacterium]
MPKVDLPRMRDFVACHYATKVAEVGPEAERALRLAIENCVRVYDHFEPPTGLGSWVLLIPLQACHSPGIADTLGGSGRAFNTVSRLADAMNAGCCVLRQPDGSFLLFDSPTPEALSEACKSALVYAFEAGVDVFRIQGHRFEVPKTFACVSVFAAPAFSELREALEHYDLHFCRYTKCALLAMVWSDDQRRYFKQKPEVTMRRSLEQFLRGVMLDAEVRPEQNVDESHPVDIKVTWAVIKRQALIEIKWLGHSRKPDGSNAKMFYASRAKDGAKQLANYLDENKPHVADQVVRGYLVVYDGRRANPNVEAATDEELLKYEAREVDYDPEYHSMREDFDPPLRFYMRPKLNAV